MGQPLLTKGAKLQVHETGDAATASGGSLRVAPFTDKFIDIGGITGFTPGGSPNATVDVTSWSDQTRRFVNSIEEPATGSFTVNQLRDDAGQAHLRKIKGKGDRWFRLMIPRDPDVKAVDDEDYFIDLFAALVVDIEPDYQASTDVVRETVTIQRITAVDFEDDIV